MLENISWPCMVVPNYTQNRTDQTKENIQVQEPLEFLFEAFLGAL